MNPLVLLIDDQEDLLRPIKESLTTLLAAKNVTIETWVPTGSNGGEDPETILNSYLSKNLVLVITDFDLTKQGMLGFQGSAVQSWCQRHLIPVGDFSRGRSIDLPKEPDLFEIRVPIDTNSAAANYIAGVYQGFFAIKEEVRGRNEALRSLSSLTAEILKRPDIEPELSLYFTRLISSNSMLRERMLSYSQKGGNDSVESLLSYVIGHVLLNLVISFPGPILDQNVLAAYIGTTPSGADSFISAVELPRYDGPFSSLEPLFWRTEVDRILDAANLDGNALDQALYNRSVACVVSGLVLPVHGCRREGCEGRRGGFWCPFTRRAVCFRGDCSQASSAWIPDGADLCRVEVEFFEELVPLLGR